MNKLKVGDRFAMGRIKCTITSVDTLVLCINNNPHYRFVWTTDTGEQRMGHMPVEFVDNFTGHMPLFVPPAAY